MFYCFTRRGGETLKERNWRRWSHSSSKSSFHINFPPISITLHSFEQMDITFTIIQSLRACMLILCSWHENFHFPHRRLISSNAVGSLVWDYGTMWNDECACCWGLFQNHLFNLIWSFLHTEQIWWWLQRPEMNLYFPSWAAARQ